jgi:hypothetical protein
MNRPDATWHEMIKSAIRANGGEADLTPDIYEWIEKNVDLSPWQRSAQPSANFRPRYKNTVRGIANDMADSGELIRVDRGRFRLPLS